MGWFTAGYGVVFLCLGVTAIFGEISTRRDTFPFRDSELSYAAIVLVLVMLPSVMAWLTMDVLHRFRPRRWFVHGVHRRAKLVVLGFASGGVGAAGIATEFMLLDSLTPGALLTGGTTVLVCAAVFALIPAVRPGHCVECGYDLRSSVIHGRCPECGEWGVELQQ